ncbi:MAG: C-type lectin domain-containing protein [Kofleriaceae bacterium]
MRAVGILLVAAVGCAFQPTGQAGGAPDGAAADAAVTDGPPGDAPSPDAEALDAPPIDAVPIDAAPMCPGYVGGYRFVATSQSWRAAEADCEDDAPGRSHLVVIDDTTELVVVAAIAAANTRDVWVGVVRDGTDSTSPADWAWRWVTGGPATYLPWETGQPNNAGGFQLVVELGWTTGRLKDVGTAVADAAICECDGRPPVAADYTP